MVPWVISRGAVTAEEIRTRFGYETTAEVLRDVNLILLCGLPGYGPGDLIEAWTDGDEVEIDMADYFRRPLRLTPSEALVVLSAGLAMLATPDPDPTLASAVAKLRAALLPDADVVEIDLGEEPGLVGTLRDAAAGHRVVHIRYTAIASGASTERDVEPWTVFAAMGNWYLSGWCRRAGGERVFRVDRIQEAMTTDDRFEPPADLPPAAVRYSPGADDPTVHLRLTPGAAWVADYYPVEVLERGADGITVSFSASDLAVIARLLVRLGTSAAIVGGPQAEAAAAAVAELRRSILDRYR